MDNIVVDDKRIQYGKKYVFTKKTYVSSTCWVFKGNQWCAWCAESVLFYMFSAHTSKDEGGDGMDICVHFDLKYKQKN